MAKIKIENVVASTSLGEELDLQSIALALDGAEYEPEQFPGLIYRLKDPKTATLILELTAGIVAEVTTLGYAACEAAYRDSEAWRQQLLAYLRGNRDFIFDFLARELSGVKIEAPIEATYLAWLNVEALGLADPIGHFEKHGVGLSDGAFFGSPRGKHIRINFGCPRITLAEALRRMKTALK